MGAKKSVYEQCGLRELWLVDTVSKSVIVYRRSASHVAEFDIALEPTADESLTSPLLPGFALRMSDLFG